jgi:hypothetical protein
MLNSPNDPSQYQITWLTEAIKSIGVARIAFGVEAQWEDRHSRYRQSTEVRSRGFESHFGDVVLECSGAAYPSPGPTVWFH